MSKNPHADKNGTPKQGEELQFLDWEAKQQEKQINNLPKKAQVKSRQLLQHMKDKMES